MIYWAHSDRQGLPPEDPSSQWQGLADHVREVSALAEMLAREAKPGGSAFQRSAALAGMLHDFGKYTQCFQKDDEAAIQFAQGFYDAIAAGKPYEFAIREGEVACQTRGLTLPLKILKR